MKKIIVLLMAIVLQFQLVGCANNSAIPSSKDNESKDLQVVNYVWDTYTYDDGTIYLKYLVELENPNELDSDNYQTITINAVDKEDYIIGSSTQNSYYLLAKDKKFLRGSIELSEKPSGLKIELEKSDDGQLVEALYPNKKIKDLLQIEDNGFDNILTETCENLGCSDTISVVKGTIKSSLDISILPENVTDLEIGVVYYKDDQIVGYSGPSKKGISLFDEGRKTDFNCSVSLEQGWLGDFIFEDQAEYDRYEIVLSLYEDLLGY